MTRLDEIRQQINELESLTLEQYQEEEGTQTNSSQIRTGESQEIVSSVTRQLKRRENLNTDRLASLGGNQDPEDTKELVNYIHALACILCKVDTRRQDPLADLSMLNNNFEDTNDGSTMLEKSLDRVAELFSPEKGADYVTAALLKTSDTATIYLARNGAFDENDRNFAGKTSDWLRQPKNSESGEAFWCTLLHYCARRIKGYLKSIQAVVQQCQLEGKTKGEELRGWNVRVPKVPSQLSSLDNYLKRDERGSEWDIEHLLEDFSKCFTQLPKDIDGREYRDFVTRLAIACYYLRHAEPMGKLGRAMGEKGARLCDNIKFLGRFVAAFETLSTQCGRYRSIQLELLGPSTTHRPKNPSISAVKETLAKFQTPEKLMPSKISYKEARQHAEMQLLGFFEREMDRSQSSVFLGYIGISKKTCFICCEILKEYRHGFFKTRGSHGTVWSGWTIARAQSYSSDFNEALRRALDTLAGKVSAKASNYGGLRESSAGMTVTTLAKDPKARPENQGLNKPLADYGYTVDQITEPLPWTGSDLAPWTFQINAWTPDEAVLYDVEGGGGPGYLRNLTWLEPWLESRYQDGLVESTEMPSAHYEPGDPS